MTAVWQHGQALEDPGNLRNEMPKSLLLDISIEIHKDLVCTFFTCFF